MSEQQKPKLIDRLAAIRRRRRFVLFRRLSLFLALITFAVLLLTGFFAPVFTSASGAVEVIRLALDRGDGFPLKLNLTGVIGAHELGQGLVVAGENDLSFISPSGKQVRHVSHSYDNPLIKTSSDRVLIYTRGAQDIRIEGYYETLLTDNVGQDIYLAQLAENGVYALATSDAQYRSSVGIYSSVGTEIFNYKLADEMPSVITFSDNSKYVALATLYSVDGVFKSNIYTFSVQQRELIGVIEGVEGLCLDLVFQGSNRLLTVFEDRIILYDISESTPITEYPFDERQLLKFSVKDDGDGIALVLGELQLPSSITLTTLDASLRALGEIIIPFTVDNIYHSEYNIYVSSGNSLYSYDIGVQLPPQETLYNENIVALLDNGLLVSNEFIYEFY